MRVGYGRFSTRDQNPDGQRNALEAVPLAGDADVTD